MAERAQGSAPDMAEFWKRVKSGRRQGHYYAVLVGIKHYDPPHIVAAVERGFPYAAFERLQRNTALSPQIVASAVVISERTLARRKESGRLDPEESDRLLRFSRIFARAVELFEGNVKAAANWIVNPQKALGGETPVQFAKTDAGALEVDHLIGRLEHGIPT